MLSFAEEIFLLALDDTTGRVYSYSDTISLGYSLIGAILSELFFQRRIDTDIEHLIVVDKTPTRNKILDSILSSLPEPEIRKSTSYWLKKLLYNSHKTQNLVLSELVNKRILEIINKKIFWKFYVKRYHILNNNEVTNVKNSIRKIILNKEEVPDSHEAALIGFIHACNLSEIILSPREMNQSEQRIRDLAKIDPISREVIDIITKTENSSFSIFHIIRRISNRIQ